MVADEILDTSVLVDLLLGFQPAQDWFVLWGGNGRPSRRWSGWRPSQARPTKVKRAQTIRFLRQFRLEHPTEADNRWAMRQWARFHLSHGIQLAEVMIA